MDNRLISNHNRRTRGAFQVALVLCKTLSINTILITPAAHAGMENTRLSCSDANAAGDEVGEGFALEHAVVEQNEKRNTRCFSNDLPVRLLYIRSGGNAPKQIYKLLVVRNLQRRKNIPRRAVRWPCEGLRTFARADGGRGRGAWGDRRYGLGGGKAVGCWRADVFCPHAGSPAASPIEEGDPRSSPE